MTIEMGFAPFAAPTARLAFGLPIHVAIEVGGEVACCAELTRNELVATESTLERPSLARPSVEKRKHLDPILLPDENDLADRRRQLGSLQENARCRHAASIPQIAIAA
jgi:hypothetical protein